MDQHNTGTQVHGVHALHTCRSFSNLLSASPMSAPLLHMAVALVIIASSTAAAPPQPLAASCLPPHSTLPFCNTSLPENARLSDLISRLTTAELVGQLFMDADLAFGNTTLTNSSNGDLASTGVPRLGLAQFNFMGQGNIYRGASNGCNLGCCTGGHVPCIVDRPFATVFPQGTGLAATFDTALAFEAGVVASDESRAIQHGVKNRTVEYRSGASSVINIARDPRWGRVPETYGECPELTGAIAVAFNKALLGFTSLGASEPPPVLKTLPVIRHLGAYAGPDSGRFGFDAHVGDTDLALTYLPAWRRLVEHRAIAGAMSAISALNGVPGIAHTALLTTTLRNEWNFDGFVISDCDTFPAMVHTWAWASDAPQASATALRAGGDINCGPGYAALYNATRQGYISRSEIEVAARRVLRMRLRVGDLQPPATDPWRAHAPPIATVGGAAHVAVAEAVVAGGTVLLHHQEGTLPLRPAQGRLRASALSVGRAEAVGESLMVDKSEATATEEAEATATAKAAATAKAVATSSYRIALIGPSADDPAIQAHTYHGTPPRWLTLRQALAEELPKVAWGADAVLDYAVGCAIDSQNTSGFGSALAAAGKADAIVYAGGLHAQLEEEDTDRMGSLALPGVQLPLLAKLRALASARHVPLVVILISGGPLAVPTLVPPSADAPDALLWLSYFGMSARPIAKILLGSAYPTGRLPFTVPYNETHLPPITDYAMTSYPGRTYRYLDADAVPPLFPFGFGLTLGNAWRLSPLVPSSKSLALPQLRTAATSPCNSTAGTALTVRISVTLNGSGHTDDGATGNSASEPPAHDAAALNSSRSLLLFGALEETLGPRSPFPRRALLAFSKPTLAPGATATLTLHVCARDLLDSGLGLHRQPLPNRLHLWVGDAAHREAAAVVDLEPGEGCLSATNGE